MSLAMQRNSRTHGRRVASHRRAILVALLTWGAIPAQGAQGTVGGTPASAAQYPFYAYNDAFVDAPTIQVGSHLGSLRGATIDGGSSCDSAGTRDVWYRYTADFDGQLVVSMCGTLDYDTGPTTILSVHSAGPGTVANELICEAGWQSYACFDSDRGHGEPVVLLPVTTGQDLVIRVAGAAAWWDDDFLLTLDPILDPPPVSYCSGKTNADGCVPLIVMTGDPSVSRPDFRLTASRVLDDQPGHFFYGFQKSALDFHGGKLCVKLPFTRLRTKMPIHIWNTPCPAQFRQNFNNHIQSGLDPALTVGRPVFVQWQGRDPADPFGDSLTDAVRFTIEP